MVDAGTWREAGRLERVGAITRCVWASGRDDAWATGGDGLLYHWDGVEWMVKQTAVNYGFCYSIWGSSAEAAFVGCTASMWMKWPFDVVNHLPTYDATIYAIHGLADGGSVHAVGSTWGVARYEDGGFVPVDVGSRPPSSLWDFRSVAVVEQDDVWVAGDEGVVFHWDGGSWAQLDAGTSLQIERVFAFGPKDVWFVGYGGLVRHWTGTTFESPSVCPQCPNIYAFWGRSASDFWLGDSLGGLRHWDGAQLEPSIAPADVLWIRAIHGVGADDLFISAAIEGSLNAFIHLQRQ